MGMMDTVSEVCVAVTKLLNRASADLLLSMSLCMPLHGAIELSFLLKSPE